MCLLAICLLWRNVYWDLWLIFWLSFFFFLILGCMSCLYVLRLIPHSLQIFFSYSEGCLFILFMVVFAVQKLLNLIRSHLFIFVSIFITLAGESEKILQLGALWSPRWVGWRRVEGGPRGRKYMYNTNSWFTLLYSRNQNNIVKQLYPNLKRKRNEIFLIFLHSRPLGLCLVELNHCMPIFKQ